MTAAHYRIQERKDGGYEASNPEQGYRTAGLPFTLTRELTTALKEISWREGVTLYMTLLA